MANAARDLLLASREYACETRWLSWWYLGSTLGLFITLITLAFLGLPLFVRIPSSVLAGLIMVRLFILYHDYLHGAILSNSSLATVIMYLYGIYALNPPSIWKRSHDHHHRHNSKILGASIGSFPIMTSEAHAMASKWDRFRYAACRHGITIALGYATIFLYGMCTRSFLTSPKKHVDSAVAILVHLCIIVWLAAAGWDVLLLALMVPFAISSALGAYLFYAQHNFPSAKIRHHDDWNYVSAALHSSSFIEMSPVMHWFTGNIGYHHVHHLNHRIPFYRLPEAMANIKELQSPGTTSLHPRAVLRCLRLKLWNPDKNQFVTNGETPSHFDNHP